MRVSFGLASVAAASVGVVAISGSSQSAAFLPSRTDSRRTNPVRATTTSSSSSGDGVDAPPVVAVGKESTADEMNAPSRRSFLGLVLGTSGAAIAAGAAVLLNSNSPVAVAVAPAQTTIGNVLVGGAPLLGEESIMAPKAHGTSASAVQSSLRFDADPKVADRICNYNRHFAEFAGYYESTSFVDVVLAANGKPITFYDSVTGKPLFVAPLGRSLDEFLQESSVHGWPSFRDTEVVWDNVRVLKGSGETVSVDGSHLGHNLPDRQGNRYCINLVSIAGNPANSLA